MSTHAQPLSTKPNGLLTHSPATTTNPLFRATTNAPAPPLFAPYAAAAAAASDDHDHDTDRTQMLSALGDEARVRRLLEQRHARAAVPRAHDWDSDYSDSPSVYSPAHFSPRVFTPRASPSPLRFPDAQYRDDAPPASPLSPLSDRERLADPALSGLDLSDDPRYSFATSRTSSDNSARPSLDRTLEAEEHDNARAGEMLATDDSEPGLTSHMSFLGPKMKIHTPAPWEMSEDDDLGHDSDESAAAHPAAWRAKPAGTKAHGVIKGLGFAPRPNMDARPSGESSRSAASKKSYDSGGALQSVRLPLWR